MHTAASFKSLYQQHYGFVWATVCRFGVAPMLAEDAVHDTFIVAYRRRDAFDGQSPKSWLYSIGRRVASNYRRTRGRRESRHASAADFTTPARDLESSVSAKVVLDRFLETLSTEDRELFVLSELDGLSGPELAATLGRKLPTVYGRVRILRQRFHAAVAPDDATLLEAQRERPNAKASGWIMLQPWLAVSGAAGGSKLVLGALAIAVTALVTAGVVATRDRAPQPPSPSEGEAVAAATTAVPEKPAKTPAVISALATPPVPNAEEPTAPRPAAPRRRPASLPKRSAPTEPAYDLAADTKLLQDANAALRGDNPTRALDLLAQHEREFPSPAQPDLRTSVWIGALCAQGRPAEARRRAAALRRARPNSPLLPRIDATCAGKKIDADQP